MRHLLSVLSISALLTGCLAQTQKTLVDLEKGEKPIAPPVITLKMSKYTPTTGRTFKDIFVVNFSSKCTRGKCEESYSRDGMTDTLKANTAAQYGFANTGPYTVNNNFSDLMLYLSGIVYSQQNLLYCALSQTESTSNDIIKYMDDRNATPVVQYLGLRDCERSYLGLNPNLFDFDKDGIPDYLELRCGLNPKNPNDAALSLTGESISSLEKCKRHIAIDEAANSPANQLFAYQYKLEIEKDGTRTFTVSNIPVLENNKQNLIAIYMVEIDPNTSKTYLSTAWSLITPTPTRERVYRFNYWVMSSATTFNQEISFP
ncbi:MAG: hypothetical protein JST80_11400 [Bdellovibrionales bacterium]|nr:hypothetical protein [Bdellovibrionales bacterium]